MKQTTLIITLSLLLIPSLPAQSSQSSGSLSISQQLYSFSPLARIILKHLGMEDKNLNGVIDKGIGEGYEAFIAKYGNADIGFPANGITYGANNGRLEEPEIVNHYYLTIRFKYPEETSTIDNEINAYFYDNNLPLVWLDDKESTVMKAVTQILGEGWNEKQVTENEAVNMFNKVLWGIKVKARPEIPSENDGYYTLSEFIKNKSGYCFEVAQFGFWFFSELRINSTSAWTALTSSILHEVVKLSSGKIVDYFESSNKYKIPLDKWYITNPLQTLSLYYNVNGKIQNNISLFEQSVIYDKYNIDNICVLLHRLCLSEDYNAAIVLGEYYFQYSDTDKILSTKHKNIVHVRNNIKSMLGSLLISYSMTNNKSGNDRIVSLLKKHYSQDKEVTVWIEALCL